MKAPSLFALWVLIEVSSAYVESMVPSPAPTPPAELRKRQLASDPRFIGYWAGNPARPAECSTSMTWISSSSYGRCCLPGVCPVPTACLSDSLIIYSTTTITCTTPGINYCVPDYVYSDFSDRSPLTWIGCDSSRPPSFIYQVTGSTTINPTPSPTSTSTTSTSSSTTTPTPSPTPSPTPAPDKSSGSKAWIAGAVVGPIAAIAIIGLGIWIYKLKKNKPPPPPAQPPPVQPSVAQAPPPQNYQPPYDPQYPQQQHMSWYSQPPGGQPPMAASGYPVDPATKYYSQMETKPTYPTAVEIGSTEIPVAHSPPPASTPGAPPANLATSAGPPNIPELR